MRETGNPIDALMNDERVEVRDTIDKTHQSVTAVIECYTETHANSINLLQEVQEADRKCKEHIKEKLNAEEIEETRRVSTARVKTSACDRKI